MVNQPVPAARSQQQLIELVDVSVTFGRNPVLRDIRLSVPRGQTLVIIGESGCGKTVILKTMIGLVRPTRGQVAFDGNDINKLNEKELTHERIRFGYLFQGAALFDSLTVGQNVAFPLREHTENDDHAIQDAVIPRDWPRSGCPKA